MNTPKPPWDDERPAASAFEVRRKQSTQEKGQNAEDAVAKWLQDHQYVILARNWRWHRFELDLVARRGDRWLVVEVKSRSRGIWNFSEPESVIRACLTRPQENRIRLAMEAWARHKCLSVRIGLYLAVVQRGQIYWYLLDDG
jgi:Holliday junction resolvase-like predicted endonuclease